MDDEIDVLWQGRSAIERVLSQFGESLDAEDRTRLERLLPELDRIRLLRVERQTARRRAKRRRRAVAP